MLTNVTSPHWDECVPSPGRRFDRAAGTDAVEKSRATVPNLVTVPDGYVNPIDGRRFNGGYMHKRTIATSTVSLNAIAALTTWVIAQHASFPRRQPHQTPHDPPGRKD